MNVPCTVSSAKPLLLVADDDRDSADYLGLLLQSALCCEVATAYDGGDALAQARARPPVAMILDLEMPVRSGTEVARQIRADSAERPVLVVVSGNVRALQDLQAELQADGLPVFDQAFGKPLRFDPLLEFLIDRAGLVAR